MCFSTCLMLILRLWALPNTHTDDYYYIQYFVIKCTRCFENKNNKFIPCINGKISHKTNEIYVFIHIQYTVVQKTRTLPC